MLISAADTLSFSGLNTPCLINSSVEIVINYDGSFDGFPQEKQAPDVQVICTAPDNSSSQSIDVICRPGTDGRAKFVTQFRPDRVGIWLIGILHGPRHIPGSPFECPVFDIAQVRVSGLDVGLQGQDLTFTVDASNAGPGTLKIDVVALGNRPVYCSVREDAGVPGLHHARFTPIGPGQYKLNIQFNGMPIDGSPFVLGVANSSILSVYGDQLRMATVERPTAFFVHAPEIKSQSLACMITSPSNKKKWARITPGMESSSYKFEWKPIELGEHLIDILLHEKPVYESPIVCNVGDPDLVAVSKMPTVIEALNVAYFFEIDAAAAGSGNLEITINDGAVVCHVKETGPRHFLAHFFPIQPIKHNIEMRFNGEHVRNSPWSIPYIEGSSPPSPPSLNGVSHLIPAAAEVDKASTFLTNHNNNLSREQPSPITTELTGSGLFQAAINRWAWFEVRNPNLHLENIIVRISDAEGRPHNVDVVEEDGRLRCQYQLNKIGDYKLELFINGHQIEQSPLTIAAFDPEKVVVKLVSGKEELVPENPVRVQIDATEAGKGQLEISVNQGQVPNNVQMQDAGRCLVTFIPQYAGTYVIDVTFNGLQVHGCPIKIDVQNKAIGKPVTAPVYTTYSGPGQPQTGAQLYGSPDRGPSSAYFSSSPRVDTSYAPTPASQRAGGGPAESPRSPQLIATSVPRPESREPPPVYIPSELRGTYIASEVSGGVNRSPSAEVRSAALLKGVGKTAAPEPPKQYYRPSTATVERDQSPPGIQEASRSGLLGYTVAQYGASSEQQPPTKRYYFGTETKEQREITTKPSPPVVVEQRGGPPMATSPQQWRTSPDRPESAQFEMTRSAELTLFKRAEQQQQQQQKVVPITITPAPRVPAAGGKEGYRSDTMDSRISAGDQHVYDQIPAYAPEDKTRKAFDLPYTPLPEGARRTVELYRDLQSGEVPTAQQQQRVASPGSLQQKEMVLVQRETAPPSRIEQGGFQPRETAYGRPAADREVVVEPSPPPPKTERGVDVGVTNGGTVSPQSPAVTDIGSDGSRMGSRPSSKSTTPKLGLKFGGSRDKSLSRERDGAFDFGKSKIRTKNEVIRLGKDVDIRVEGLKLGSDDRVKFVVLPPSHTKNEQAPDLPYKLKKSGNRYDIHFHPTEVGTHRLLVFVNDKYAHPSTPFAIRVYDANQIQVGEIVPARVVHDTVEFTVDASRAGFGNLEIAIKDSSGTIIPSHVSQLEANAAKFLVTFNPTTFGTHTVNITFNKEIVQGSPFEVEICENEEHLERASTKRQAKLEKLSKKESKKESKLQHQKSITSPPPPLQQATAQPKQNGAGSPAGGKAASPTPSAGQVIVGKLPSLSRVGTPVSLTVSVPSGTTDSSQVHPIVYDPDREPIEVTVFDESEIVKSIQFTPTRVGDYEVQVLVGNVEVNGSPFTVRAYDPTKIAVSDIPDGMVGKETHFTVDASIAGVGNLEVAVNDGRIPSMAHGLGQHRYDISFVPMENIDHTVSIRFNNEPVPGSPFLCRVGAVEVTASGPGLERVAIGHPVSFWVTLPDAVAQEKGKWTPPKVQIIDPRGEPLGEEIAQVPDEPGRFEVHYTAHEVGNHQVSVRHEGQHISGSPFVAKAFDAHAVRLEPVDRAAVVGHPCTFTIDAAKAGAGNMEIIVSNDSGNVPNFVQPAGQAKFDVSFTPQEAVEHIVKVTFNGISVPGSPMRVPVSVSGKGGAKAVPVPPPQYNGHHRYDESSPREDDGGRYVRDREEEEGLAAVELRLVGDLHSAQLGEPKRFSIDAVNGGLALDVQVTGPDGEPLPVSKTQQPGGGYDLSFTPHKVGAHQINIGVNGRLLAICPIICDVFAEPSSPALGSKGAAKKGTEALAEAQSLRLLDPLPDKTLVEHTVVFVVESTMPGVLKRQRLTATIKDPDGTVGQIPLNRLSADKIRGEWQPMKEGSHVLRLELDGKLVCGTPRTIDVLDLSTVRVVGLKDGIIGVQQTFNLDWSKSGGTSAAVSVVHETGESVKCSMKRVKKGLHVCSFNPKQPGLYLLTATVDGLELPECPYECYITDENAIRIKGEALHQALRGKVARFEVTPGQGQRGELDVLITGPNKTPLPVRCYKQYESYWVEFTPEQCGSHLIEVTFADVPVAGSPFQCEVVDPRSVRVRLGEHPFVIRQAATVTVERNGGGSGQLTFDVSDPQGQPLKVDRIVTSSGDETFTFLPTKLGIHRLSIKIAGFSVTRAPSTFVVEEFKQPAVYGAAIEYAVDKGQQASLIFDPNRQIGGLKIEVLDPEGSAVRYSTNKRPDDTTEIAFRPQEVGIYRVSVDFNGRPVSGSPFSVDVVDPLAIAVNDEHFRSDGIWLLSLYRQNVLDIDATAAGPARLRVEVRDSDGEIVDEGAEIHDIGRGRHQLLMRPRYPGKYKLYLYCSELVVPSAYPLLAIAEPSSPPSTARKSPRVEQRQHIISPSPKQQRRAEEVSAATPDHLRRVVLVGDGLRSAIVGEQAEFIIDCSEVRATGAPPIERLTGSLAGDKADIPVRITPLRNQVFKAIYTPTIAGRYQLSVLADGHHVKGSPTNVSVLSHETPAKLIEVDARALKYAVLGAEVQATIDTRKAGPGQLSAQCAGPQTLEYCEILDNHNGTYVLRMAPKELGKHTLTIKYSNDHVPGSPFGFNVGHAPDPSRVRVWGPGIEHGILHSFRSDFYVETKGAGMGKLAVRVSGPKGAFNVEMERDRSQEGLVHCKYDPREPGGYQVDVQWHGQQVPGSPFVVLIVDTEEELQRFLAGAAPSPPPPSPFVPPGWIAPRPPPFMGLPPPPPPPGAGPPNFYGPAPALMGPPPGGPPPHHFPPPAQGRIRHQF